MYESLCGRLDGKRPSLQNSNTGVCAQMRTDGGRDGVQNACQLACGIPLHRRGDCPDGADVAVSNRSRAAVRSLNAPGPAVCATNRGMKTVVAQFGARPCEAFPVKRDFLDRLERTPSSCESRDCSSRSAYWPRRRARSFAWPAARRSSTSAPTTTWASPITRRCAKPRASRSTATATAWPRCASSAARTAIHKDLEERLSRFLGTRGHDPLLVVLRRERRAVRDAARRAGRGDQRRAQSREHHRRRAPVQSAALPLREQRSRRARDAPEGSSRAAACA